MPRELLGAALREPILILGGYGYRNVGDEAMLAGLLRALGPRSVSVVSRRPAETAVLHGVPAVGIPDAAWALARHRSLLIGGGGLFGRDMGAIGRLLPAFGLLAQQLRRDVAIHGVGLDDGLPRSTRLLLGPLARRAVEVSVRDRRSAEIFEAMGVDAIVAPDLSSHLPAAAPEVGRALLEQAGLHLDRPIVGLCLTAMDEQLADAVALAVAGVVRALPELQFCFVPMSRHPFVPRHDDVTYARRLQTVSPSIRILEGAADPADLLSVFGQLSVAVCMRYHSLLFASRLGIPIVPIAYAQKCRSWLAERGRTSVPPEATAIRKQIEAAVAGAVAA
jgi:polysaccharide pyruvyl transferase WcaK-like protein